MAPSTSSQAEGWMRMEGRGQRGKSRNSRHFSFFPVLQRLCWEFRKKIWSKLKGQASLLYRGLHFVLGTGTQSRLWNKALIESPEGKQDKWQISWVVAQDERHQVPLAWVRSTRMGENYKSISMHNKWWDGSGKTVNSCLVSSELTAATSVALSLPPAPLTSSPTELMIQALQCGSEAPARGKGIWMLLSEKGRCQVGTTLTK